ncbi:hypothetical protein BC830DRAFT_765692 [Chytriomyces sp. MP71]|nr:hypothetical protein BC830DRAFT_765692 [Chytriomyces sp. MP71]
MTNVHAHSNGGHGLGHAAAVAVAAPRMPHSVFETKCALSSGNRSRQHRNRHYQQNQQQLKDQIPPSSEHGNGKAAGRSSRKHHPRDNFHKNNKHLLQCHNSTNKQTKSTASSVTSTTSSRTSSQVRKLKWADKQALEAAIRRSRRATSLGASAAHSSEPHLDLARDSLHQLMREAFATCPPEGPISREDLLFNDSFYTGASEVQSYGPADSYTPYCQSFHASPSPVAPKLTPRMQPHCEYSYDSDDLDADQYMSDFSSGSSRSTATHKEGEVDDVDLGREIDEACNELDLIPSEEENDVTGSESPPFDFGSTPARMDPYASLDFDDNMVVVGIRWATVPGILGGMDLFVAATLYHIFVALSLSLSLVAACFPSGFFHLPIRCDAHEFEETSIECPVAPCSTTKLAGALRPTAAALNNFVHFLFIETNLYL